MSMFESLKRQYREKTFLAYLAIVRIFVGYHFISVSWGKVSGTFLSGEGLPRMLADVAERLLWIVGRFVLSCFCPKGLFLG